jgi:hypothetical protein
LKGLLMNLSRRNFSSQLLGSLLTFSLVKSLNHVNVLAKSFEPIARRWLIEMEEVTQQLRQGKVKTTEWQNQIESLLSRVDLNDLLTAIDYDKLAKTAVFPEDHESAEDVDFSHSPGLPAELSFSPYFYAMKKGTAIVPHGHRNMTSMHMMLKGQSHGWQFERVSDEAQYVTIKPTNDRVLDVGVVTTVSDERNNIHWFKALSEPVFMFNIGVFRLNPSKDFSGRDYVDPIGGEKLGNGLIRARRLEVKEAYQRYGKS